MSKTPRSGTLTLSCPPLCSSVPLAVKGFLVLLIILCHTRPAHAQPSSPQLSKFFTDYFEERLRDEPEFATTVGRHEYDDRWSDLSKAGRDRHRAHLQARFDQLSKFSLKGVSDQDRLSVDLLRYDLRTTLDALDLAELGKV